MWVFELFNNTDIFQFDIQILVNTLQRSFDGDVIFELYSDFMVNKSFEKAETVRFSTVKAIHTYLKNNISLSRL
jgi:hypothetical protein